MSSLKLSQIIQNGLNLSNSGSFDPSLINSPNGVAGLDSTGKLSVTTIPTHSHDSQYLAIQTRGVANGVASLDATGKVPISQLPSSGISTAEYDSLGSFPQIGQPNTFYLALDTNLSYVWSGTQYTLVSSESGNCTSPYTYRSIETDETLSNHEIVYVNADDLTITLPENPINGHDVTLVFNQNSVLSTTVSPNGSTINGDSSNLTIEDVSNSVYFVYIDGWKTIDQTQIIQITKDHESTNPTDSVQYLNLGYWPDGVDYSIVESTIFDKTAWEEEWSLNDTVLARQITIFEENDNVTSTWIEDSTAIDKLIRYEDGNDLPTIQYRKNNKIAMCEILGVDWRQFETFHHFISDPNILYAACSNQEVLDLIKESQSNLSDFIASTALPIVSNDQMTSNNTPSGVVTSSSIYEDFYDWRAFDGKDASFWSSTGDSDEWISYEFPADHNVFLHTFEILQRDSDQAPREIILQYSSDGENWSDLEVIELAGGPIYSRRVYNIFKANAIGRYWRVYFKSNYGGSRIGVYEIVFRGWNLI